MGNEIDLRFDLPFGVEKVWRALTTPELLAVWLGPNNMVPVEGARFTVRPEDDRPVACEVLEIDARRRRLRLAWNAEDEEPTTVRFEVVETANGALLKITHARAADAVATASLARPPHQSAAPTASPPRGSRRARCTSPSPSWGGRGRTTPSATRMKWAA